MPHVAIAAGSTRAAEAGAAIASAGGNAVDACLAATLMSWVAEPGLTSVASGAHALVWPAGAAHATLVDGFFEMPGRSAPRERFGHGVDRVVMNYGGETITTVGAGSVATPGALAALAQLHERHGQTPWGELFGPAVDAARNGFPLPMASWTYFKSSGEVIFSRTPDAHAIAVRPDGAPRDLGETVRMPDLADTFDEIARDGAAAFYEGEIGARIAAWVMDHGGLLGRDDLAAYRAVERPALELAVDGWAAASTPPPAVGGAATLDLIRRAAPHDPHDLDALADAMRLVFEERGRWLRSGDVGAAITASGRFTTSGSTSHVSTADRDGLACSITTSTGYTCGVIPPGTGVMLNNGLGELELFPAGLHAAPPGGRLRSNMAPLIARHPGGDVLALGAAGADRITTALAQVWRRIAAEGRSLEDGLAAPRAHLEPRDESWVLAIEPGLADFARDLRSPVRIFEAPHMFFGGVQAAERRDGQLDAAGDPRRGGQGRLA